MKKLALIAFIFSFIVFYLTSDGKTPFDYFTRLSDSFLQGKIYLSESPPWLNELIPAYQNRFYVVYPPMPAILAMPFRFILKELFEQQYLSQLLGAGVVALTMLISWSIKKDRKLAVWSGTLMGFGTIIWFLASSGSVWYLSQVSAIFFLTCGIYEGLNKKRPFILGLFLGAAYLSRIETILVSPLFIYFIRNKNSLKKYARFILGISPFVIFNFLYNYLRFGVIWDKAYVLIPGVMEESWFQNGLFNLSNIPKNLKAMFLSFPVFLDKTPFVRPSWAGLSIWITTPAFIYALFDNIKERVVQFSWISIFLISLVIFSHGTTGFAQFGYRFAADFYPILILLVIRAVAKKGLSWHHWVLLLISMLVNLWGVLWINKFGWIGY